jgi:Protein of unknown function (DUF1559)
MTGPRKLLIGLAGAITHAVTMSFFPIGLAPASSATQEKSEPAMAEAKKQAAANLANLAKAMHQYHSSHGSLPPAALVSKDGKPLLSWRVLLLPFVGAPELFQEFKLAEPWDSAHNSKLLAKMPAVFAPTWGEKKEPWMTPWQVFLGPGAAFEGTKGVHLGDISRAAGTTRTFLIVEGRQMVPWTKPAELQYDPKKDVPPVGCMFPDIFLFANADGSVRTGVRNCDPEAMRCAIVYNDGKLFDTRALTVPAK